MFVKAKAINMAVKAKAIIMFVKAKAINACSKSIQSKSSSQQGNLFSLYRQQSALSHTKRDMKIIKTLVTSLLAGTACLAATTFPVQALMYMNQEALSQGTALGNIYSSVVKILARDDMTINHCTGTLINSRTVLTAASCVTSNPKQLPYPGFRITSDSGVQQRIAGLAINPDDYEAQYNPMTGDQSSVNSNMAMITLTTPIIGIKPVALAKLRQLPPLPGEELTVVGDGYYGVIGEYPDSMDGKHRVGQIIIGNKNYGVTFTSKFLNPDSSRVPVMQVRIFYGDLGGPLFQTMRDGTHVQVGVASGGRGGAVNYNNVESKYGAIATWTSIAAYRDWIDKKNPLHEIEIPSGDYAWSQMGIDENTGRILTSDRNPAGNIIRIPLDNQAGAILTPLGNPGHYFNVTLSKAGAITLHKNIAIDHLTISNENSTLRIGPSGHLKSITGTTMSAGTVGFYQGTLTTSFLDLQGGALRGQGTIEIANGENVVFDASAQLGVINKGMIAPGGPAGTPQFGFLAIIHPSSSSFFTRPTKANYYGEHGTLFIKSILGDDDQSERDKLLVTDDTYGFTKVTVENIGGTGAQTVKGIEIVHIDGKSDGTFALEAPDPALNWPGGYPANAVLVRAGIPAGDYLYSLMKGNGLQARDKKSWYLVSSKLEDSANIITREQTDIKLNGQEWIPVQPAGSTAGSSKTRTITTNMGLGVNGVMLNIPQGQIADFSGIIDGIGRVIKLGGGEAKFTNTKNSYDGTTIYEGVLVADSDKDLGSKLGDQLVDPDATTHTFSGDVVIDGGTWQLGQNFDETSRLITLGASSGRIDVKSSNAQFKGAITGPGDLFKTGAGTLTSQAKNTYTGATIIDEGPFKLSGDGDISASRGVVLNKTASFDISQITKETTIQTLSGRKGTSVNIGTKALVITNADNDRFDGTINISGAHDSDPILSTTGNLEGIIPIHMSDIGGSRFSEIVHVNGDSHAKFVVDNPENLTSFNGSAYSEDTIMVRPGLFLYGKDGIRSFFSTLEQGDGQDGHDNTSWYWQLREGIGEGIIKKTDASIAINGQEFTSIKSFDHTGPVIIGANGGMFNTNGFDSTFSGVVSGTGPLIKRGQKTLTLKAASTYTGETIVDEGTLKLAGNAVTSASSEFILKNDAILDISEITAVTAGIHGLSGDADTVVQLGKKNLILNPSDVSEFSGSIQGDGAVWITSGFQIFKNGGKTPNLYKGGTVVGNGATVSVSENSNLGEIHGGVGLLNATLQFANTFTTDRPFTLGASTSPGSYGVIDVLPNIGAVLAGKISGLALVKTGLGILTLTNDENSYLETIVNDGNLVVAKDSNLGDLKGGIILDGGTLQLEMSPNATKKTFTTNRLITLGDKNGTLYTDNVEATFNGVISGSGGLFKKGKGKIILTAKNTFIGGVTIEGDETVDKDIVNITSPDALGAAPSKDKDGKWDHTKGLVTVNGGTLQFGADFTLPDVREIVLGDKNGMIDTLGHTDTINGVISGSGPLFKRGDGTLTLAAKNTYTGKTEIDKGTLKLSGAGDISSSSFVAIYDSTFDISNITNTETHIKGLFGNAEARVELGSKRLVLDGLDGGEHWDLSNTFNWDDWKGDEFPGIIQGSGELQISRGLHILTGANTYTGDTTIDAKSVLQLGKAPANQDGKQNRSGSLAGNVTLGGALTGNGTIGGSVSSFGGSIIAPGGRQGTDQFGTLTIKGNLESSIGHTWLKIKSTLLGDIQSKSDELIVNGNMKGGFDVSVERIEDPNHKTDAVSAQAGLKIVEVNGSKSEATLTLMGGPVKAGAFTYSLQNIDKHWYLTSVKGSGSSVTTCDAETAKACPAPSKNTVLKHLQRPNASEKSNGSEVQPLSSIMPAAAAGVSKVQPIVGLSSPANTQTAPANTTNVDQARDDTPSTATDMSDPKSASDTKQIAPDRVLTKQEMAQLAEKGELNLQDGVALYESYTHVLQNFNSLSTLHDRAGNRYWDGEGDQGDGAVSSHQPGETMLGGLIVWSRVTGTHEHNQPQTSLTSAISDSNLWKMQMGIDAQLYENEAGRLIGSVWGHYGSVSADISSQLGKGTINAQGFGGGSSLTWYGENGFYVDAQGQFTHYTSSLSSADLTSVTHKQILASGNEANGYGVSLEVGKRFAMTSHWSLTPQAQLSYSVLKMKDFTDPYNATVHYADPQSLTGRVGVSLDYQNAWKDSAGLNHRTSFYGRARLIHEFHDQSKWSIDSIPFTIHGEKTSAQIAVGGSYSWHNDRYELYGGLSVTSSLAHPSKNYSTSADLSFKIKF